MSVDRSEIRLEIEVPGRPEEVWRAVATGPGISSWYVPHTVEEREGGAATASFGPGPEMQVAGRVAVWEPPRRVALLVEQPAPGTAFMTAEGFGEHVGVSIWSYLYGDIGAEATERARTPLATMVERARTRS